MMAYAKHLPVGVKPASDVRAWGVPEGQRWRRALVPIIFAPLGGSWFLAILVAVVLALAPWAGGSADAVGTTWNDHFLTALSVVLPLWYRYLPVAAAVSAAALLARSAPDLSSGRVDVLLPAALSLWALTGALLRLWSRRRQERIARAAAGPARFAPPDRMPRGHDRRGMRAVTGGAFLCLAGVGVLVDGIVEDLTAHGTALPYDAVGQQTVSLALLAVGTTLLGRGWSADRASRRPYREGLPALVVGVRAAPSGHLWLYPDADDTTGRPLISCRPREDDTLAGGRLLAGWADGRPGAGLHDVDALREPFEAVLYGEPREGVEIVLEYAVHDGSGSGIRACVTAAPLSPRRRHRLGPWTPAGISHRAVSRVREREEWESSRRRRATRATATGTAAGTGTGGGCGGDGGCGGGGCGGCGCG
ncbi:hypothetical protein [Streptomyces sp. NPDC048606]|uniref:hypothetical protein n=1 Tax=Streptomyces sp. NPDC048606 TaxID=3154726 RepID=UPI003426711D